MQVNDISGTGTARYVVRSSDVLEDMRINVHEEGSDRVIWYKERFLTDDEILEHLVDNATSIIVWTIHRPKRGWYIRLRTPSFPPGVFIPLLPLPQSSPYHAEAALSFACRTSLPPGRPPMFTKHSTDSDVTLTDGAAPREHSYPPTPPTGGPGPAIVVKPPSPRSVHAKLDSVSLSSSSSSLSSSSPPRPKPAQAAVTHFVLTPHSRPHVPEPAQAASLFSRLMAVIRNNAPSHAYSFTLSPIPTPTSVSGPAPLPLPASSPSTVSVLGSASHTGMGPGHLGTGAGAAPAPRPGQASVNPLTPTPLLTFHDRTPVWTARCTSGLIEMDEGQCRVLGVEPAFYVAVALTYLEFLEERESYLVAAYD